MHNRKLLIKKLIYQSCKRGCKETDAILGNFSSSELYKMNDDELREYEIFLENLDADIWDWVNCKSEPECDISKTIVDLIRANLISK